MAVTISGGRARGLLEILKGTAKRYEDPLWWEWLNSFLSYEVAILKQPIILYHIVLANYPIKVPQKLLLPTFLGQTPGIT